MPQTKKISKRAMKTGARTVRLVRPPVDGIGVFHLQVRKEETYYTFCEIPCEIGGRGFALHRLGVGLMYHVRIGTSSECSCDCMGFLAHGNCKHVLSLLALERAGLI